MDRHTRRLYRMQADILAALGHPIRLAVVEFLRDGEQCVCDIAAHLGAGRSNVSRHLAVLLKAGVVDCRKDGLRAMYSLKTPCVQGFLRCVRQMLRQQARERNAVLARL